MRLEFGIIFQEPYFQRCNVNGLPDRACHDVFNKLVDMGIDIKSEDAECDVCLAW